MGCRAESLEMTTAAQVITTALRLFGIIDQTETGTPTDIANNVVVLNDLLRADMADGACQYIIKRVYAQLPAGVTGQIYSFSIGIANSGYLVQQDAVAVRSIWMNDINLTVNRETRMAPSADVVRTTYPGRITKWHQERQSDNSVLVTAWQPPNASVQALIEYGGRLPLISAADGSDVVALPSEAIHDAALLLGRRIYKSYGVVPQPTDVIFADAERVNARWRQWARGQQWLRRLIVREAKVTFETLDYETAELGKEQRFDFNCPKHDRRCGSLVIAGRTALKRDPQGQNGGIAQWGWDGNREYPTFTPSVNCGGCWHGYIRNGRTVDCQGIDEPEIVRART